MTLITDTDRRNVRESVENATYAITAPKEYVNTSACERLILEAVQGERERLGATLADVIAERDKLATELAALREAARAVDVERQAGKAIGWTSIKSRVLDDLVDTAAGSLTVLEPAGEMDPEDRTGTLPPEPPDLKAIEEILLGLDPTWANETLRGLVAWIRHIEADAEPLERVRRQVCAYGPAARTCDCKFYNPDRPNGGSGYTGCAEMRTAVAHLRR